MTVETFVEVAGKPTITKDPNAELDYTIDYTDWLAGITDTIASVDITVSGGVTLASSSFTTTKVTVWISGGTVGTPGSARVRITTAGAGARPRIDDRTIYFKIKER